MINFIISAFKIIFLLGFLILIHEGGHFLVAKFCKVRVKEFAIGFGPTIWKRQGKETKYALRLIPLGGFVNLEGESEHSDEENSFSKASIPKRIAIVAAGAVVNILFAIIVYFTLLTISGNNISTVVDETIPNYSAELAGIMPGDEIVKINGRKVRNISDINKVVNNCNGEEISLIIKREENFKDIKMVPTAVSNRVTGIYLYKNGNKPTQIAGVAPNSAAESAGIKEGDVVVSINNEYVKDNQEKMLEMLNSSEESLNIEIERFNNTFFVRVAPTEVTAYYMGIKFKYAENTLKNNLYYASLNTIEFIASIVENLSRLFSGKASMTQVMGPVGISEVVSKTASIKEFVYLLALISMSLGVTNLLPFPPLDGGKILFLVIEAIRKKPMKEELELQIQMWGFAILITLSIYIAYHDILRIF